MGERLERADRGNGAVEPVPLGDYGLTEAIAAEVRARDQSQSRLFAALTAWGCGALWLVLTVLVYAKSARSSPVLGLVVAPLLGLLGAGIGSLPIMIVGSVVSFVLFPRHPQAEALERYEAAAARIRICDVCALALEDYSPKREVTYCAKCDAWLCPDCRGRYDLRAIAALKRAVRGSGGG